MDAAGVELRPAERVARRRTRRADLQRRGRRLGRRAPGPLRRPGRGRPATARWRPCASCAAASRELGFKGLRVIPWLWEPPPTDRRYYPLYAAVRRARRAVLHAGRPHRPAAPVGDRPPDPLHRPGRARLPRARHRRRPHRLPVDRGDGRGRRKHENVYIDTSAYTARRYPPELVALPADARRPPQGPVRHELPDDHAAARARATSTRSSSTTRPASCTSRATRGACSAWRRRRRIAVKPVAQRTAGPDGALSAAVAALLELELAQTPAASTGAAPLDAWQAWLAARNLQLVQASAPLGLRLLDRGARRARGGDVRRAARRRVGPGRGVGPGSRPRRRARPRRGVRARRARPGARRPPSRRPRPRNRRGDLRGGGSAAPPQRARRRRGGPRARPARRPLLRRHRALLAPRQDGSGPDAHRRRGPRGATRRERDRPHRAAARRNVVTTGID